MRIMKRSKDEVPDDQLIGLEDSSMFDERVRI